MSKQVDRARQQGWKDGLQYALKLIREGKEEGKDPEEVLIDEIKFRGITGFPITIPKDQALQMINGHLSTVTDMVVLLTDYVHVTEFSFTKEECERFARHLSENVDELIPDGSNWEESITSKMRKAGIPIKVKKER